VTGESTSGTTTADGETDITKQSTTNIMMMGG